MAEPPGPPLLDLTSWRGLVALGVFGGVVLLSFAPVHGFVHEFLGHGLAALALGQSFTGIYLTPFGAQYSFETLSLSPAAAALQLAAGSLVSVAAGFVVFLFVYPRAAQRSASAAVFVLFAVLQFETDLMYPFLSTILNYGDLDNLAKIVRLSPTWAASLVVAPLAFAGLYPVVREYLRVLSPFCGDLSSARARLLKVLEVGYLPVIFYIGATVAVLYVFSGPAVSSFWAEGSAIGVSLLLPVLVALSLRPWGWVGAGAPSLGDAGSASVGLRRWALVSVLLIVVFVAAFGPTFESSWGWTWG
ncbi:MAG: hypothetical protein JRN46_01725 [Nitrososphaerota archaeon]|nr:hypothetical protein [Nitrososphaerota archaeon]